jgi:hypothetical protein
VLRTWTTYYNRGGFRPCELRHIWLALDQSGEQQQLGCMPKRKEPEVAGEVSACLSPEEFQKTLRIKMKKIAPRPK